MFVQADFYQEEPDVVAAVMTQLSLKSGLKEWGDRAHAAVHSEMKQLHFRHTFKPMHWSELSEIQRQTVLESHMFLKEKCSGKIKGRTVAWPFFMMHLLLFYFYCWILCILEAMMIKQLPLSGVVRRQGN